VLASKRVGSRYIGGPVKKSSKKIETLAYGMGGSSSIRDAGKGKLEKSICLVFCHAYLGKLGNGRETD